jgi:hypothetical protein
MPSTFLFRVESSRCGVEGVEFRIHGLPNVTVCVYTCIMYMYVYMYMLMCVCIYFREGGPEKGVQSERERACVCVKEREREREREREKVCRQGRRHPGQKRRGESTGRANAPSFRKSFVVRPWRNF